MHATSKRITHCKQNSRAIVKQNSSTLQTKLRHAANKRTTRCKQNFCTLQTKLQYAANKRITRCKQNSRTLQTKELHAANKTPACCKQKQKVMRMQDDVKDPGTCSRGSWRSEEKFTQVSQELRSLKCCSEITRRQVCQLFFKRVFSWLLVLHEVGLFLF